MPRTTRLLVAALAFVTLSLNPLESFAGPLQGATQTIPPDWLTRNDRWPRQTQGGMSCTGKILLGLGIGAGVGLGWLAVATGGVPRHESVGVSLALGSLGSAMGYKMCR